MKKRKLQIEQKTKLKEMIEWLFTGYTVNTSNGETFSVVERSEDGTCTTFHEFSTVELLIFHLPEKLGMDFVHVDPVDMDVLFDQISERYDDYTKRPETSEPARAYEYEAGMWGECGY